ncbi:TDP1 [Symbiodinium natans]|uniref:TDP1 protein n=1 Tax=Symbiodinium natans TaxID=878477 RepID=A0A812TI40_9DINO|nr:TDP1 [Symbiodinium natans]
MGLARLAAAAVALFYSGCGTDVGIVKGISYGPMPCKGPCTVSQDDFFSQSAKPMWGRRGRGDLEIIRQLGANTVRLYGNNPENTHRDFLDEAKELGLAVVPGLSDYDFIQSPTNCLTTDFNCYNQVKSSYKQLLQNGFLLEGRYHPALREIIVINEPDLKLPGLHEPKKFCRGVLSAIDAMLDAENEVRVNGTRINFTVAFSFGVCTACANSSFKPALGQMAALRAAMHHPESVGYDAHNNLTKFYHERFHNSFNTANPAVHVKSMFLDSYVSEFPTTPVMIQEYHNPHGDVAIDLKEMLQIVRDCPLLNGVSFFEFHVRYDKGGTEMDFGIFKLGDYPVVDFDYFGDDFQAWCLVPAAKGDGDLPRAVAAAYGGSADFSELCIPDPRKVSLTPKGYQSIAEQEKPARMQVFIDRLVTHFGGKVADAHELDAFARGYTFQAGIREGHPRFPTLVGALKEQPNWATWNNDASCVADRDSHVPAVGSAVGDACRDLKEFRCLEIPDACKSNIWDVADYVFGVYYAEQGGKSALEHCYFNGAATLAGTPERLAESKPECVVPRTWKPKRRLLSYEGDLAFERFPGEAELGDTEDEEAAGRLLVPSLLAGVAAVAALVSVMACLRDRRGSTVKCPCPLESPAASSGRISIQVVPVASCESLASTVAQLSEE